MLTLQEVADNLRVPLQTLYKWRVRGEAPRGVRVGRHVRVSESELERWKEAHTEHPISAA